MYAACLPDVRRGRPAMTETRSPADVAGAIAEDVRTLNYQTGAGGSVEFEYPSDLNRVLSELMTAAQRLPQLFGQMATWLAGEYAAGRVGHDSRRDAGEYVEAVTGALSRASLDAETLAAALSSAHDASGGLTGVTA